MIVEIIAAALGGGTITAIGAVVLGFRKQSHELAREDAQTIAAREAAEQQALATREELERQAIDRLLKRYEAQLDEQAERHRAEIETQARHYEAQLKEAASKLAEQIARADAAELESERERSRRREAERERDEKSAQLLRTQTALDTVNDRVVAALKRIEELERDRRPSGEHRAISSESGAERKRK